MTKKNSMPYPCGIFLKGFGSLLHRFFDPVCGIQQMRLVFAARVTIK
jgi:hypothetical protein